MSYADFKAALADAMGKEAAYDAWDEGGRQGDNPESQIDDQAAAMADAIRQYLRDLSKAKSEASQVVTKP